MDEPHYRLSVTINGQARDVATDAGRPLADVLREDLGLVGTRIGCRNGDCGACTVLIDGASFKSCMVPCHRAAGRQVTTLEGLAADGRLHPVQRIFWEQNAFQCGFCLAGHILCTVELLRTNPAAGRREVEEALAGNLCRCTGYQQIVSAALAALEEMRVTRGNRASGAGSAC